MSEESDDEQVEAEETAVDQTDDTSGNDAQQGAETEEEPTEEDIDGLQEGDVVRVDLTAYTVEEGLLVDTTDPEVAEEEGVDENQTIEPRVVVIGEGHLLGPVDEALIGLEAGDSTSLVVDAVDAFGEHDPDQVRTISVDKIDEDDRYPGAYVEIDGQNGFVETIIGGRARVDFNHPFAGDDIEYEIEVLEELDDREELAHGLIQSFLNLDLDLWFQTDEVEVEPEPADDEDADEEPEPTLEEVESLYLEATPELTMNQQWMFSKQQIAAELIDQLDVDRVVVQEIIDGQPQMPGMGGMMGGEGLEDLADIEDIDELEDELDLDDLEE